MPQRIPRRVVAPAAFASERRIQEDLLYLLDLVRVLRPHSAGLRRWSVMRRIHTRREAAAFSIGHWMEDAITAPIRRNSVGPTQGRTLHRFLCHSGVPAAFGPCILIGPNEWLGENVSSFEPDAEGAIAMRHRDPPCAQIMQRVGQGKSVSKSAMLQDRSESGKHFALDFGRWIRRAATSGRTRDKDHAPYRKCPSCGEPKFRISDRQRAQPEQYRSRTYRVKWLCLSCGKRETEMVEEP